MTTDYTQTLIHNKHKFPTLMQMNFEMKQFRLIKQACKITLQVNICDITRTSVLCVDKISVNHKEEFHIQPIRSRVAEQAKLGTKNDCMKQFITMPLGGNLILDNFKNIISIL